MLDGQRRYHWRRFWCPRDGHISVDWNGYLLDPEKTRHTFYRTDVVPFEDIDRKPCLILLGEPGIGKSDAMEQIRIAAESNPRSGEKILFIDFRYDRAPQHDLFEHPDFCGWLVGDNDLLLLIDGLDECPMTDIAARLIGKLRRDPRRIARLRLRVSCRTASLPTLIDQEIPKLWNAEKASQDNVGVYELAPLRQTDVERAANAEGIDATAFLREIALRDAVALAIKPITLKFLLNIFRDNHALPQTRWETYERGCLKLCSEENSARLERGDDGRREPADRLAIAARIAAVSMLGARSSIYLDSDPGDLPKDALLVGELVGGSECVEEREVKVDAAAVKDTVMMTGLFTGRGRHRLLGWMHQTYAEFLAAYHLRCQGFHIRDLEGVLFPRGGALRIFPAMREVAAWMASADLQEFATLIEHDPSTLLQSDTAMVDDALRERLVESLLDRFGRDLLPYSIRARIIYPRFAHRNLVGQLRRWIRNRAAHRIARQAAIDMAEACALSMLQDDLADVAEDQEDAIDVRAHAAAALGKLGSDETKKRLWPLARGEAGADPDHALREPALRALWPGLMSTKELFECLTPPPTSWYYGSYWSFVNTEIANGIIDDDVPVALECTSDLRGDVHENWFETLKDNLARRAWDRTDEPAIMQALVIFARPRIAKYKPLFKHTSKPDPRDDTSALGVAARRRFVVAYLSTTPGEYDYSKLEYQKLLSRSDADWMLDQFEHSAAAQQRERWASLVGEVIRRGKTFELMNAVATVAQRVPDLLDLLSRDVHSWLKPVEIGSSLEAMMRDEQRKERQTLAALQRLVTERVVDPPAAAHVQGCLERAEQGDWDAFGDMQHELSLDSKAGRYTDNWQPNLTGFAGWLEASESTQRRILDVAKRYLIERDPIPGNWPGEVMPFSVCAAYRALFLLYECDRAQLDNLPVAAWRRWAPAVIGFPHSEIDQTTRTVHCSLVGLCYRRAPDETASALKTVLDRDNRCFDDVYVTRYLDHCWDERIGSLLLAKLQDPSTHPVFFESLLDDLLAHKVPGTVAYATSLLDIPGVMDPASLTRARAAAKALLRRPDGQSVLRVIRFLRLQPEHESDMLLILAESLRLREQQWKELAENALAEMLLWLEDNFPPKPARTQKLVGLRAYTDYDHAKDARHALLRCLQSRGTDASLEAIRRVEQAHPKEDAFKSARMIAEEYTLAAAFRPLSPKKVLSLNEHVSRCDILLITARPMETQGVLHAANEATGRSARLQKGKYHDLGEVGGARVFLVESQMGTKTPGGSYSTTLHSIRDVDPSFVIMVGFAFGVDPEVQKIGNILVSSEIQDYELQRVGQQQTIPRGPRVHASPKLLDLFKASRFHWDANDPSEIQFCLLLSGDKVIDNIEFRDELLQRFSDAKGGEMEAIGVSNAASEMHKDWIIVKAISDFADGKKNVGKDERQRLAASRAASFVMHTLRLGGFRASSPP